MSMDEVVQHDRLLEEDSEEHFLLREGLELLANFRAIPRADVRAVVRNLIATLSLDSDVMPS